MKKVLLMMFLPLFLVTSATSPANAGQRCEYYVGGNTYYKNDGGEIVKNGKTYTCVDGKWKPKQGES